MFVLLFLIGILAATQLTSLPNPLWLVCVIPFIILFFTKYRWFTAFFLGFSWAVGYGIVLLSDGLTDELENKKAIVQGVISSLPDLDDRKIRFNVDIKNTQLDGVNVHGPKRIRLSWYGKTPDIKAGEQWQFYIKLKRVSGMMNPGGFDYERWAFEQGINATAYVVESEFNKRLSKASLFSINNLRSELKEKVVLQMGDKPLRGLVLALLLGDRSEINEEQWNVLTATGTNHLVAISGLHIGLVAGAVFFLGRIVFRRLGKLLLYIPAHKAAAVAAIIAAFIYAMLAGFAIPTQRALVMILVVMLSLLVNRKIPTSLILSTALFVVLILDPFSILSAGFWLSFAAVAAILYAMQSRWKAIGWWWKWGRLQWIVTIALIPILIFSFQQFSIISPVANFFAVPWVSILVVPLVLIAGLFSFIPIISEFLFYLSHELLVILWYVLTYFADFRFSQWNHFMPVSWAFMPALISVMLFLSPRGLPGRYLALVFCLPLFFMKPEKPEQGEAWFTLLDVGQGLSAVVQTKNHLLLFDTGPKFSDKFDTGKAVVLPYLKSQGISHIDMVIISHGDNDHIGGLDSILGKFAVTEFLSGDMEKTSQAKSKQCLAGQNWVWDGVTFQLLHPSKTPVIDADNNDSCVLRISTNDKSVLITGDIEKQTEKLLVNTEVNAEVNTKMNNDMTLKSDILVVPHHGSNTSSTAQFIETVNPKVALYPASYSNRYGFPKAKVVARYNARKITQFSTGEGGALLIKLNANSDFIPSQFRLDNKRFWHR